MNLGPPDSLAREDPSAIERPRVFRTREEGGDCATGLVSNTGRLPFGLLRHAGHAHDRAHHDLHVRDVNLAIGVQIVLR